MISKEQLKLLQEFGEECYWYGECTGDYGMSHIFEDVVLHDQILDLVKQIREWEYDD